MTPSSVLAYAFQMTELEAEFETIKGGKKAKPERLLRSQQQIAIGGDDDNDAGIEKKLKKREIPLNKTTS